jgi:hypothetical protein
MSAQPKFLGTENPTTRHNNRRFANLADSEPRMDAPVLVGCDEASAVARVALQAKYLRENPDRMVVYQQLVPTALTEFDFWRGSFRGFVCLIRGCC